VGGDYPCPAAMRRIAVISQILLASILLGGAAASAHTTAAHKTGSAAACHRKSANGKRVTCRKSVLHRAADPVSGTQIVGLNADVSGWGGASTADRLNQVLSSTGAKWLREEFDWAKIEPQPGQFDFSDYDHFMLEAAQRGERVLALLYETPSWAGSNYNSIPSNPSAFAGYVAAVVGRYGPHGSFWKQHPGLAGSAVQTFEVWNEPYVTTGDNGDYDPGRYARLVKAAAIAGHRVDPQVKFLMAAEMQSAMVQGRWQWWVNALYKAVPDLNRYFDGVAMHDYGTNVNTLNPMVAGRPYNNYGHILRIENLRQQFVAQGAADKPFWITEAGWSTCTDPGADCVSQDQQAANLQTLFNDMQGPWRTWVKAAFIYNYGDGVDPSNVQDAYGLTNLDGTAKPALQVFRTAEVAVADTG
jgi:polysaccharide biosynthesis protein PslG